MKLLIALSTFAAVSVAGAGYFTVTSDTETGKELRSLIGMEECEGGTCSDVKTKPACSSDCSSSCDDEKPQDEFPS
tara:strand:- start:76 stop:303 length:228 start_codon:yes stop_codon:yes gene_type:complete